MALKPRFTLPPHVGLEKGANGCSGYRTPYSAAQKGPFANFAHTEF
jgi:hypothetical protein